MPPREEEGGSRPRGGRAEGGAQNPGGGFEGQRGREAGSVGGEGGGTGALGWGPGCCEPAWGGREWDGWSGGSARSKRTPACALYLPPVSFLKFFPASSSLSFQPGPRAPDAASQLLLLARAAKQLQNFPQNFTAWRDLGCCCEAWPAEGWSARLIQMARPGPPAPAPSCLFCQFLAA